MRTSTLTVAEARPSGIAGAPEAGEDLPPLREVPVPERGPDRSRVDGPGAASEHLVLRSEEDLRVLGVREGVEARVGSEVGRRPLPHVADQVLRAAGCRPLGVAADRGGAEPLRVGEVRVLLPRPPVAPRKAPLAPVV